MKQATLLEPCMIAIQADANPEPAVPFQLRLVMLRANIS